MHKKTWPVVLMCRVFQVVRRNYYHFVRFTNLNIKDPLHDEMIEAIKKIGEDCHYSYGVRRMRKALNTMSYPVGRHKTKALMEEAGVFARYRKKYKITTNSDHNYPVFDNLLDRQFNVEKVNTVYAGDITYIRTQEGWLYLSVVIDLYSRKVVGWSMGSRMKAKLVCDALDMAIGLRQPEEGFIHHSDQGSQYASKAFRKLLEKHGARGSMSRRGNCWDNACVESFFGSLKSEIVQWKNYQTRSEAQQDILNYITMFYNSKRLHSTLDYQSPNGYEIKMAA
jgi:putative transposase